MISVKQKGDFKNTEKFLNKASKSAFYSSLEKYGKEGVTALAAATPVDTGKTASSWNYIITIKPGFASITWVNNNVVNGENIAILLQYGHGTKNGGYVHRQDYINPAMKPIFDKIENEVWKEATVSYERKYR